MTSSIDKVIRENRKITIDNLIVTEERDAKYALTKYGCKELKPVIITDQTGSILFELLDESIDFVDNNDELALIDTRSKKVYGKLVLTLGESTILVNKTRNYRYEIFFRGFFRYNMFDFDEETESLVMDKEEDTVENFFDDYNTFEECLSNLEEDNLSLRIKGIKTIGQYRNDFVKPHIDKLTQFVIDDPNKLVRIESILTLGKLNEVTNIPVLIDSLNHDASVDVKAAAAKAIGFFGENAKNDIEILIDALINAIVKKEHDDIIRNSCIALDCISSFYEDINFDYNKIARILNIQLPSDILSSRMSNDTRQITLDSVLYNSSSKTQKLDQHESLLQLEVNGNDVASNIKYYKDKIDVLIYRVNDPDFKIRKKALENLAYMGEHALPALSVLVNGIKDSSINIRIKSAYAIGKIGKKAKPTLSALSLAFKDKSPLVRISIVKAIGDIGIKSDISTNIIKKALRDFDESVRVSAVYAIDEISKHDKSILSLLTLAFDNVSNRVRRNIIKFIKNCDIKSDLFLNIIKKALKDKSEYVRFETVCVLERMATTDEALLSLLGDAFKDSSSWIRERTLEAIINIDVDSEFTFEIFEKALDDKEYSICKLVINEIGRADPSSIQMLKLIDKALKNKDDKVKLGAIKILKETGKTTKNTIKNLIKLGSSEDKEVRNEVLRLLEQILDKKQLYLAKLKMENWSIQEITIKEIVNKKDYDESLIQAIINSLDDKNERVRWRAVWAIGKIGEEAKHAIPLLENKLHDDDKDVRSKAVEVLDKMGNTSLINVALEDNEWQIRKEAVLSLQKLGDDALPLLNIAINDEKEEEIKLIVISYAEKYGEKGLSILIKALDDNSDKVRREAIWLIGKINKNAHIAVPILIDSLKDKASQVRWRAAWGLGNFATEAKQAIPALNIALKDEDEKTRTFATEALKKIKR